MGSRPHIAGAKSEDVSSSSSAELDAAFPHPRSSFVHDHAVLAAALDPIVTIDALGIIQSASNSVHRVFGWTPAELIGRNVSMLMPEPHRSAHDAYLANYRRTGHTNILGRARQFEAVRRNGEVFPIELSVARADTTGGELPLFVGIIRDISEQKRLERELRLIQGVALSVGTAPDLVSGFVEAIRQIALATDWDSGEAWTLAPGSKELSLAASWARPGSGLDEWVRRAGPVKFRRGQGLPGQAWASGQPIWTGELSALPEKDFCRLAQARKFGVRAAAAVPIVGGNEPIAVLLFFVRQTRREDLHLIELVRAAVAPLGTLILRKRAEEQLDEYSHSLEQKVDERTRALQESQEKLRLADRMASIGTLAAGLGHDMNNVLLPVRAHLNALRASAAAGSLTAGDRKHVESIQRSVSYLQQLADGLHFLALDPDTEEDQRGGGHTTDLRLWWAQTGALLSKAVPKQVRVAASFPADLPRIGIASHGLTQAVLNLVVNAGEAIPPPSERKRKQGWVRIRAAHFEDVASQRIRLSVTDNGSGMTDEVKRRAFEMFFTTKPRGLGTGLGLSLVRKVVEHAGGEIEIESEIGRGTTVSLVLPACAPPDGRPNAPRPRAVVSIHDGRAAALIRHVLESSGISVDTRDEANAMIWIVDPSTTGIQTVRKWRKNNPHGRIVLFGRPNAAAGSWSAINPVTIEATSDFEAVRGALNLAISHRSHGAPGYAE